MAFTTRATPLQSRRRRCASRTFLALLTAAIVMAPALLEADNAEGLVKFEAAWQDDDSIVIIWETSSELDWLYFYVFRAESQSGPFLLHGDPQKANGDDTGRSYRFEDRKVTPGVTYWYRLSAFRTDNRYQIIAGPITPGQDWNPVTSTPTATGPPGTSTPTASPSQTSQPTATRQYTNTPPSTGADTATASPVQSAGASQAAPTRPGSLLVTTPTPVGGVPAAPPATPTPEFTATPELAQAQPTEELTAAATPPSPAPQQTPTPSPAAQRLASAPQETSQPLVNASAAQVHAAPAAKAPQNNAASSRLVLLIGGGALAAATILGALALLIWRRRAR